MVVKPAAAADTQAPTAPTGLTASAGASQVSLSWNPSSDNVGVTGYHVWRRPATGTTWSRTGTTSSRSYTDTAVTNGTKYTYAVRAHDLAGNVSPASATVSATPIALGGTSITSGTVLWKADAESSIEQEWASLSTHTHCETKAFAGLTDARVSRSSTRAKGLYSYRSAIQDGDSCYGERSEVGQGNPIRTGFTESRLFKPGEERWISWQTRLGSSYPIANNTWQVVAQWKQLGALYTPVLSMEARQGQWQLANAPADPNNRAHYRYPLGTAKLATWTKFTMHVKFSSDPSVGFVELFGDLGDGRGMRLLFAKKNTWTLKVDPGQNYATVPSHARLGIYRDPAVRGATEVLYDGYTVGTTRAAAEANAF